MFPDIQAAAPPTRPSSLTLGREAVSILFGVFNLTTTVHSILEMDLPVAGRSVLRCNCHRAERGGVAGSAGDSAVSLGLGFSLYMAGLPATRPGARWERGGGVPSLLPALVAPGPRTKEAGEEASWGRPDTGHICPKSRSLWSRSAFVPQQPRGRYHVD